MGPLSGSEALNAFEADPVVDLVMGGVQRLSFWRLFQGARERYLAP